MKIINKVSALFVNAFIGFAFIGAVSAQENTTKPQPPPPAPPVQTAQPQTPQQPAPPSQQQTKEQVQPAAQTAQPNLADVASIDQIVKAVYDVISGDAGVKRDWNRFRSLFHPKATMTPTNKNRAGVVNARVITPEDYIQQSGAYLEKEGFHEREIARRVEQFGNIAHVFTTYEAKHKLSEEKPFLRGINSIQLFNDGSRWWVLTIAWSAETPETPLPEKYLK